MPGKYESYAELAEKTAKQLTDSTENWTSFLTTAARLYKYPYHEQLMIFAQRPDATACADYETWNKRMGRYVRRGSTGIALLDDTGNYPKLRYVFDVADTGAREKSRELNLWAYSPEHAEAVKDMLSESFFPHSGDLFSHIEAVSANLAAEYWHDHALDISGILADSFPPEYDIDTLESRFHSMAALGTTYSILSRCGINPDLYIDGEDFRPIFEFNTPDTIAALSTAVSDMSEIVLREIERTIKNYERTHEHEERTELHKNGGLQHPEPELAESAEAGTRQIRENAPGLFEESPSDTIQPLDSVREAVLAFDGNRGDGEPENGSADGRADEIERSDRTDEIGEPDALGADDEQPESAGGGDNTERADLQLTRGEQLSFFDGLFPSESEQIEYIDRAESKPSLPFAFSFSQEEVDTVLKYGGNERDSRMRIAAEFMKDKSVDDHAAFLQNMFHGGNGFKIDGREICAWYDEDGIHLAQGRSARYVKSAQIISWRDAAARIGELLEQGQFASNVELAEAAGHERQLLAQNLCYMQRDIREDVRPNYFAEAMFTGAFDDVRDRIADMLADPFMRDTITDELARFAADYADEHSLLRFNFHKPDEMVKDFRELALMNREFNSDIAELPAVEQFITENEIDELFASHGSGVENGKQRIYDYFTADHTQKEKVDFLKNEYGIGGHSHALSRATGSDEWHDGKGIRLKKDGCYDVQLSWQNAVKRIDELIHVGRYLANDERAEDLSEKPTADETVATSDQPYQVGDTVYLDDTEFEITEIGKFDVQMRDKTLLYPIFRSESQENFMRLLSHDARNDGITDFVSANTVNDDIREVLTEGVLSQFQKDQISYFLRDGHGNKDLSARLSDIFENADSGTMEMLTGETADYYTSKNGYEIVIHDSSNTHISASWADTAPILRALCDGEQNGLWHELPERLKPMPDISTETDAIYPAEENHLPYDIVIERLKTDDIPLPENFRITDDNLGEGGAKTKFRMNMDAIYTLKILENEHRNATPDEQETLSKYVGWGGLAEAFDEDNSSWTREYKELKAALTDDEYTAARSSTLNAHYTSPTVIKAIYEAVGNMGFTAGNILEPSMGVGNFFGLLPQEMSGSRLYGVELDSITGRIAQKLYPNADITVAGFETTDRRDFFDLAVGNVPFGNYKVNDKAYNKLNFSIHDYFFAKTLDQVRPGGVIAFITSRYTMDKQSPEVRKYIAERADLLGAIRLPNNAFKKNAGTEVTTDIIFLQKRDRPQVIEPDWVHLGQTTDGIAVNSYFVEHPDMVLGTLKLDDMMYGSAKEVTCEAIPDANLADQLNEAIQHISGTYKEAELPDIGEKEDIATSIPADPNVKNYSYTVVDGDIYYRENSSMVKLSLNTTAQERVKGMVELRDCIQKLIDQQLNGGTDDEIKELQTQLNILYDNFTAKYGLINDRANRQAFSDDSSYYLFARLKSSTRNSTSSVKQICSRSERLSRMSLQPRSIPPPKLSRCLYQKKLASI